MHLMQLMFEERLNAGLQTKVEELKRSKPIKIVGAP